MPLAPATVAPVAPTHQQALSHRLLLQGKREEGVPQRLHHATLHSYHTAGSWKKT